jgi:hypothetical protein
MIKSTTFAPLKNGSWLGSAEELLRKADRLKRTTLYLKERYF